MVLTAGDGATAQQENSRRRLGLGPDAPLLVTVGVAATLAYLLVHRSLIDDAYITMTYARNVAFHLHWGLVAGETANSATSPLNVLLLAAVTVVVRNPVVGVGILFVASVVLTAWWLAALARRLGLSRATPWIAVAFLLPNPLLLSTVGLESYLAAALFAGLLRYGAAGRPVAFGVVAGLAVLARPDLAVVVVVAALGFAAVRRKLLKALAAAVAVAAPWHVFSWFVLGSAVPDTLVLKLGQGTWAGYSFATGPLMYLHAWPVDAALSFVPVVLGGAALVVVLLAPLTGHRSAVQRVAALAGLAAVAHYTAYGILGTPPYHWYYAPFITGLSMCAALVAGRALAARRVVSVAVAAVPVVVGLAMATASLAHGVPWSRAAIATNWAGPAEYERIASQMRAVVGDQPVESPGEIGTLAYYCGCTMADAFSDRGRMIELIEAREARSGPLGRTLIGLNYLHLDRAEPPRQVAFRLEYLRGVAPAGPRQWPVWHWAEGPGRMVLLHAP